MRKIHTPLFLAVLLSVTPVSAQLAAPQLDGKTVYQVLLGEIALQRGSPDVAAAALAEAARRTVDPALLSRAIQVASTARRHDLALELAQRWVDVDPDSTHARQMLIGMLGALGRTAEMTPHLRRLLEQEQSDRPALERSLLLLNRLLAWGQDKQATYRLVEQVTVPYRDIAEAQFTLGQAARAAGETDAALAAARRAQQIKPDWVQAVMLEVQVLGREGVKESIDILGRFLQRNPGATEARLQRARLLAAERRWEEARKEFEAVVAESGEASEALYPLAVIAAQQHDVEAAEKYFKRLLETSFPDRSLVLYQLGVLAEERKDLAAATAYLEQVGPGEYLVSAKARIAQIMARQGHYAEARAFLRGVTASEPQDQARLVVTEAQILRESRDFQGAFDVLETALKGQPNEPDLLYDQAMVAERLNRVDVLEANMRRVIAIRPENAHAYNALGYSLADRNIRLDEARQLIGKALELAPEDPFILDSMGWVLYRLGRPEEALKHLERAYRLRPDPEIAAHMGEVLWVMGRRDEARRIWREARQKYPDNEVLTAIVQKFAP